MNTKERFDREWNANKQRVYWWCLRLVGNVQEAEDLMQDTAIKALVAWPRFEHRSSFTSWVSRIAVNQSRDRFKKKRLQTVILDQELGTVEEEDSFLRKEMLAAALTQIKEKLPTAYYEVWAAYTLDGLQYREIALTLGLPEGTVKSRLNRARALVFEAVTSEEISA